MPSATHPGTQKSTTRKTASKSTGRKTAARGKDAVALLKADHRAVEKLFSQFEQSKGETRKQDIARKICMELKIHTQLEEELVYPTSREFLKDDDIVNEAIVEHNAAKDLIAEIEGMQPSDEMFEAKVKVLQEQIEHHVQEEETEYFPQLQKSDMDLKRVGQQIEGRKKELTAQMGGDGRAMQ